MKDGDGVAKLVCKFEKRLTDNISIIPKPIKRGRAHQNVEKNLLKRDDELLFLDKLH